MNRNHVDHIPENQFHSHFGQGHEFHIDHTVMIGGHRGFHFGGVSFGIVEPLPVGWLATDPMYVDYIGSSYFLCNRAHPGARVAVSVEDCAECGPAPVAATCDSCTSPEINPTNVAACADCSTSGNPDGVTTLSRGQTIAEVVSVLGAPTRAIDLGAKQIYVYPNMKVTFLYGWMNDVL